MSTDDQTKHPSAAPTLVPGADALHQQLDAFAAAYDYDVDYLRATLEGSRAVFERFTDAQGLSSVRRALPRDAHFIARVATMRGEDCGPCTLLNLKMALEAGVPRELLETALSRPEALPGALADVWAHAAATVEGATFDGERAQRLRLAYGDAGFVELAAAITGARLYPTMKRALGYGERCAPVSLASLVV